MAEEARAARWALEWRAGEQPSAEQRVQRSFVLLTDGADKPLDATHICYQVLNELEDGADIEAALRYLIARFSVRLPYQIIGRGHYGES